MFNRIQQLIINQQDGLEDLLIKMESVNSSSATWKLEAIANNKYLTFEVNRAFSEWYISEHYNVQYIGSQEEPYSPSLANILEILQTDPDKSKPVRLSVYSEDELVVRPDHHELEDYFLLTPKT